MMDVKVKYETSYVVNILKAHMNSHVEEYEKAMKVYYRELANAAEELIGMATNFAIDARANDNPDFKTVKDKYDKLTTIKKPVDASKMYDQLIVLFTATTDETIELTLDDANSIINDEWDWAVSAKFVNSSYTSSR